MVSTQVNSQCSMVVAATERNRAKEETREHSGGRWEGRKASLSLRLQRWGEHRLTDTCGWTRQLEHPVQILGKNRALQTHP